MSAQADGSPLAIPPITGAARVCRFAHEAMACLWELFIPGEEPKYARQAAAAAFAEVDRLEQELSRFIPHSDIARLSTLPAGGSLRVGADALECLELAAQVHRDTRGAFDVTLGALVAARPPCIPRGGTSEPGASATGERVTPEPGARATGHRPSSEPGAPATGPPSAETPDATPDASPIGMHLLEISRATHSATVHAGCLVIDLGAIGKGHALDRAVAVLREWSVQAALVHSGQSTVYALGAPPGEPGWTVAIRNPTGLGAPLGQICLRDAALGGSGVLWHGRHIIDPRTRQPATGALGAWVLAPSTALADALSTAFMVLSPPEVAEYCQQHPGISGLLFVETPDGHALLCYGSAFSHIPDSSR